MRADCPGFPSEGIGAEERPGARAFCGYTRHVGGGVATGWRLIDGIDAKPETLTAR